MRKRALLALALVAALLVTSGCSLIVKDEEVDKATPIVQVLDKTLTKADFQADYATLVEQYASQGYDVTGSEAVKTMQDQVVDQFVGDAVLEQKFVEAGLNELSDEDKAQAAKSAQDEFDTYFGYAKDWFFTDTELTGDELTKAVEEKMTEIGWPTLAQFTENAELNLKYNKLLEMNTADVTVTDEDVQAEYDAKVEAAKSSYETTPAQYLNDVNNEVTVYYRPAGYRYVKNLLIKIADEDKTAISDLNSQLATKRSELSTAETSLTSMDTEETEEFVAALTDEDKTTREETRKTLNETKATLTKEIDELTQQMTERSDAAFAAIQEKVDEVQAKIDTNEDFDALIATYGEDDGMKQSPAKEQGYLVCEGATRYVAPFTEVSMALEKVGDVSAATRTEFGVHFIQYASDVTEGPVDLSELKDTLYNTLLTTKKDTAFSTLFRTWVDAAGAKIDLDALKD